MEAGLSLVPSHQEFVAARPNHVTRGRRDRFGHLTSGQDDRAFPQRRRRFTYARRGPNVSRGPMLLEQMSQPIAIPIFSERRGDTFGRRPGHGSTDDARRFGSQRVLVGPEVASAWLAAARARRESSPLGSPHRLSGSKASAVASSA